MEYKNIIYTSYDGITDPLGQSQILPYLFGLRAKNSFSITIVSFEKSKNFLQNKKLISEKLEANKINWIHLKYSKRPPIISTIWDIYKLRKAIYQLKYKTRIDLIHCRSYITSLVGLEMKKKHNIPFIFDMRGFYPDERVDGKIWNQTSFIFKKIYAYFKLKEKEFLRSANATISLTKTGKKEIISWGIAGQSPITVIPCCTDETIFQKKNFKNIRSELGFGEHDFIISYVGSIGTWYMLDEMLDFFKCLQIKKTNAKFFFITKDDPQTIFEKAKIKKIDSSLIKVQSSSREKMPSYINVSNFSIFFILPVFSKKASCPTKMGEIMNLGVPIICNKGVGDVEEIMNKCMPELLIENFKVSEYNKVIDIILNNYKIKNNNIIKTSINYFSLKKGIKKYTDVYKEILN